MASPTQIRGTTQIIDGTIADAKIAAAAGIQTSKLAEGALFVKSDGTVVMTAPLNLGTHPIINVTDPTNPQDAATRAWTLTQVAGISTSGHTTRGASTANVATLTGTQTIDGVALAAGDRILLKNQTTPSANGIYVVATGAWARATDFNTWNQIPGAIVSVEEGTTNADTIWLSTADMGGTLGTTPITFTQLPGPSDILAGAGLTRVGQTISVAPQDNTLQATTGNPPTGGLKVNQGAVLLKSDYVTRETPGGLVNGSNTNYTLANPPIANSEQVFLNGLLQEPGAGNDYTIVAASITFLTAPLTGDRIRVTYMKGAAIVLP
jgi:hypothetical protein